MCSATKFRPNSRRKWIPGGLPSHRDLRNSRRLLRPTSYGFDLAREIHIKLQPSASTIRFEYTTGRALWRRHDINCIPGGCAATSDRIFCNGFQGASAASESVTYFIGNVEIRK